MAQHISVTSYFDDEYINSLPKKGSELADEEVLQLFDYERQTENVIRLQGEGGKSIGPEYLAKERFGSANNALWRLGREPDYMRMDQEEIESELRSLEHRMGRPPERKEARKIFNSTPEHYASEEVTSYGDLLNEAGMPENIVYGSDVLEPEDEEELADKFLSGSRRQNVLAKVSGSSGSLVDKFRAEYEEWEDGTRVS